MWGRKNGTCPVVRLIWSPLNTGLTVYSFIRSAYTCFKYKDIALEYTTQKFLLSAKHLTELLWRCYPDCHPILRILNPTYWPLFNRFCRKPAVRVSPEYPVILGSLHQLHVSLGNTLDWTHGNCSSCWTTARLYNGNNKVYSWECIHTTGLWRGRHPPRVCEVSFYVLL